MPHKQPACNCGAEKRLIQTLRDKQSTLS